MNRATGRELDGALGDGRRQALALDGLQHQLLEMRLQRSAPHWPRCEHCRHGARAGTVRVGQAAIGVHQRRQGAHAFVEDLLHHRPCGGEAEHVGAVEQCARWAGQPDPVRPFDDVHRVDPPTPVHHDALQLGAAPVRHEQVQPLRTYLSIAPQPTGRGEADHREGIPGARSDHLLLRT